MRKRTLGDWASIAEIVGTATVVVSLLFVGYSVQQNTQQLRLQNNNYLYDQQNAALETMMSQPLLIDALIKFEENANLSASEELRLYAFNSQATNRWEMSFYWHQEGVMSDADWEGWNQFFRTTATRWLAQEQWEEMRNLYSTEFAGHVDQHFASIK